MENKEPIRVNPWIEQHGKLIVVIFSWIAGIFAALVIIILVLIFLWQEYQDGIGIHTKVQGEVHELQRIHGIENR